MASQASYIVSRLTSLAFKKIGGNFLEPEADGEAPLPQLGEDAQKLVDDAFVDVDCSKIIDYHTHIMGKEVTGTGCYCHPAHFEGTSFKERFKANVFMAAAGVTREDPDTKFVERLLYLIRSFCPTEKVDRDGGHLRNCILAFDYTYTPNGEKDPAHTSLHVPNDYVLTLAAQNSDAFIPACSVHPYRKDAINELRRCRELGVRIVKWLPNSQLICPKDERCIPFYDAVRELDMVILCHTGDEHALTAGSVDNTFGNPLMLKCALDRGAKVIMAHCASEGTFADLENKMEDGRCPFVSGVDLLLRLFAQEQYKGRLFADISAITSIVRSKHLPRLLQCKDIHDRLIFGSDYPVPAVNAVTSTRWLWKQGLLTRAQCAPLNEIYRHNPLLYDYVLKRTVEFQGSKFPPSVFQEHQDLQVGVVISLAQLHRALPTARGADDVDMIDNDEALLGIPPQ